MLDPDQIAEIRLRWRIVFAFCAAVMLVTAAVAAALPYLEN